MSDIHKPHLKKVPLSRCRNITCKGMEVYGNEYLTPIEEQDRTHDFHCVKTQSVMGPDGALVLLSTCDSSRECFEEL